MKTEDLEVITTSIKDTLGDDATAQIADSLGLLITENTKVQNTLQAQEKEIQSLKEKNDRLITANANLLQQVPIAKPVKREEIQESKKSISLSDCFDSKGNFKRSI